MKILLLGPQGCGKGTIGKMLSEKMQVPLVSSGDMLRAIPENNQHYKIANEYMNKGELVPQYIVAELLRERVAKDDCKDGFIFDGWGRCRLDLELFDPVFDRVVVLNISRETSIKRISGRRLCDSDGKTYNILTLPPEELAKCTGNLTQRVDDTEEAVNRRLDIYYKETQEVIDDFKKKGILVEIDAEPLPDVIFAHVVSALGLD
ncbi:MAG: nucleoside monophosphate kinase [Patescibacteria group bacterium]|jgi:adenylate kinase